MKLRIRDNSIRLRLTQSEVDAIGSVGEIRARVSFPGGEAFDYVLESSDATPAATARFSDGALTVCLPRSEVQSWATTEQVSIAGEEMLANGAPLKILVEKDFACLSPREGEDESDMFPHPQQGQD